MIPPSPPANTWRTKDRVTSRRGYGQELIELGGRHSDWLLPRKGRLGWLSTCRTREGPNGRSGRPTFRIAYRYRRRRKHERVACTFGCERQVMVERPI